jgi:hypothetical protein
MAVFPAAVLRVRALNPTAVESSPTTLLSKAPEPTAVFCDPVVRFTPASHPRAVLSAPVVSAPRELTPSAVFLRPVVAAVMAPTPTEVLDTPVRMAPPPERPGAERSIRLPEGVVTVTVPSTLEIWVISPEGSGSTDAIGIAFLYEVGSNCPVTVAE